MIFDGKSLALRLESSLKSRVNALEKKPELAIILVGSSEASVRYVQKKKEAGERIGITVNLVELKEGDLEEIKAKVKEQALGNVDGLMVQLPIPGLSKEETDEVLRLIPLEKDVDGLNSENLELLESGDQTFIPATVKAVERVLDEAFRETEMDIDENLRIAVVGAQGMVGKPLVTRLKRYGIEVGEFDLGDELNLDKYDVVISCTGKEGLIKSEILKNGVIAIDVGFPKGDFDHNVEKKAAFFTPVPGGVGPVTVVSLLENVVAVAEEN